MRYAIRAEGPDNEMCTVLIRLLAESVCVVTDAPGTCVALGDNQLVLELRTEHFVRIYKYLEFRSETTE